jgi:hypothetical protein
VAGRAEVEASHGNHPGARLFLASATCARSWKPLVDLRIMIANTS